MKNFHLAQINIARAIAPLDSPILRDFMAALEPINLLAEQSPGFLWRLKDESGNATQIRIFDDPCMIINLSLWSDRTALFNYVYRSAHAQFMARRKEWFEYLSKPYFALWWIEAGHLPTLTDAAQRLQNIQEKGPTSYAFNFKNFFEASMVIEA